MSAVLLQDNKKYNELKDNRESCLHVLTWTALHFTNHAISGGGTSRFLRAFDEEYEDEEGVKGGDLKMGFLATCEMPCVVKFDRRPQLDKLIRKLTKAFAVRYEEPPSADQFQVLERAPAASIDPSIMLGLTVFNYQKRLDDLVAPSWLVDTFRRYLDADTWPPLDEAQGQLIRTASSKKRARELGKLEVRIPGTKSQRRFDSSGSRTGS
jgi:hypothetical protein